VDIRSTSKRVGGPIDPGPQTAALCCSLLGLT
jgi:hypothetical protein